MKNLMLILLLNLFASISFAELTVMHPGEAHGQLVFLSGDDVLDKSDKYQSLSPLSIPVFAEMPLDLSVVAGTITLKEQNQLSHVQIKARARKTVNLDISKLPNQMNNDLFSSFKDGDWVHLTATADGQVNMVESDEKQAKAFYKAKLKAMKPVTLDFDIEVDGIKQMAEIGWQDHKIVGSKAANYAELAKALNTGDRQVVRPSMALPFFYYAQFVIDNPDLEKAIGKLLKDPLMRRVDATKYRDEKLEEIRDMIEDDDQTEIDGDLLDQLIDQLDEFEDADGDKMKMKFRSSTNAEDLPNFNGAGLYSSKSYKPNKKGKEKKTKKKKKSLEEALRRVWASVWNLRAFEEREIFSIGHDQIYMGVQINPSFSDQEVDGVIVTHNIINSGELTGPGVYLEAQRGEEHSVANPLPGVTPEKILVLYDSAEPLNQDKYVIKIISQSNIADDGESILDEVNPSPVMREAEVKDVVYQSLKAQQHFNPIFDNQPLDLEFKVDDLDQGNRQVYLKQVRPYIP